MLFKSDKNMYVHVNLLRFIQIYAKIGTLIGTVK